MDEALNILVVDDDAVDRMAAQRSLRASGLSVEVEEAGDGAAALRMLASNRFDCALLDYRLPDRDGLALLREVRAAGMDTPVIMLTGQGDERVAVEMMKAGASDYLTKGRLTTDHLAQSVRNAVRVHRAEMLAESAVDRLRESEGRFRMMADSAPVLLWLAGPDASAHYFNQGWLRFTGRALEQEVGEGWAQSVHPDDRPRTLEAYRKSFEVHQPFEAEYRLRRADGEFRWVFCKAMPRFLPDGTFAGYIGSCIDINDRKYAEEQLKEAKEASEAANKAKDQFLAVLSHELRTPLMPVLAMLTSLEVEHSAPDSVRSALEMIRRNVELEARLIDDLLDLTRISKGKLQLNLETVDAHVALKSALEICQAEASSKRLSVKLDLGARQHHICADSARIQQVFWNLLKNAVKFTPSAGAVTIRSRNSDEGPSASMMVEITDTGIGIEPEVLPRIFQAFEQGERAITRQFGGLGLGLAICKALVERHGGHLAASSAGRGEGATFTVELPVVRPGCAAPSGSAPLAAPEPSHRLARLLVVDDHADTSRAMKRLLERLGYTVEVADSVGTALEALRRSSFDLLISDIGLPDGSGLDIMREARQLPRPIKAIALSGFGMEEDIRKSKEAGFVEHLTKPVNFRTLEASIQSLLSTP